MYLYFHFLPKNSHAVTAQLKELEVCKRSNERITWTWCDKKYYSFEAVKPHRKNS